MAVDPYEARASYSADMARKVAGIENRGPDGAGLVPQNPAPPPTVLTEDELAEKQRHIKGTPLGPVPVGGLPVALPFLVRNVGGG